MRFSLFLQVSPVVLALLAAGCPDEPARTPTIGDGGATSGSSSASNASLADRIRGKLTACTPISTGMFKTDEDQKAPPTIPICDFGDAAIWWRADMDIDCDGKETAHCNLKADPAFQKETSATTSKGEPLEAEVTPYVVIPRPSPRFDYQKHGIALGAVVMVVYKDKVAYGVFADTGPAEIIGEASYAMAKSLGIDPDPSTGGTDDEVLYVAFKGKSAVPSKLEDHAEAVSIGEAKMKSAFGQ